MGRGIRFTTEFKREAVRLVLSSGRPRTEIAEDLGVGLSSLTRWIGQYRGEEMPPEIRDDLQAELKRLRKENAVLRQERDILKKAAAFEAAGATRLLLPPYSPDFNPIEQAFAKLKALLRKAAARTVDDLWDAIAEIIELFTPTECANFFANSGYEPE